MYVFYFFFELSTSTRLWTNGRRLNSVPNVDVVKFRSDNGTFGTVPDISIEKRVGKDSIE